MMETRLQVELLYFAACPSWKKALEALESVLAQIEVAAEVSLIRVETPEEARLYRFVGSPTIRIDGQDLYPVDQADYGLSCRMYPTEEGLRGWPTEQMLKAKLSL